MNARSREEYIDFLWNYIWIVGIALIIILVYYDKSNNYFIQTYGPSLALLFSGIFIGIKYITKIEHRILIREKQERFWTKIGPKLTQKLRSDMIKILIRFYQMNLLDLDGGIYNSILFQQGKFYETDCQELAGEFEKIAQMLLSLSTINGKGGINDKETTDHNKILELYYNDIKIYLEDIHFNIALLFFIHSENAEYINTFIGFISDLIIIEEEIFKIGKNLDYDLLLPFSHLFKHISDMCNDILCAGEIRDSKVPSGIIRFAS